MQTTNTKTVYYFRNRITGKEYVYSTFKRARNAAHKQDDEYGSMVTEWPKQREVEVK